jgi:hypothetical protein
VGRGDVISATLGSSRSAESSTSRAGQARWVKQPVRFPASVQRASIGRCAPQRLCACRPTPQGQDSHLRCASHEHGHCRFAAGSCKLNLELRILRFEFAKSFIFMMPPARIIIEFIKYDDGLVDVWRTLS